MGKRLKEFPDSWGGKRVGAVAVKGPLGYATGGFQVEAKEFGMKHLQFGVAMGSDNGAYFACARINAPNEDPTDRGVVYVQVFVVGTGAEVAALTNLTGVTFRVLGVGF